LVWGLGKNQNLAYPKILDFLRLRRNGTPEVQLDAKAFHCCKLMVLIVRPKFLNPQQTSSVLTVKMAEHFTRGRRRQSGRQKKTLFNFSLIEEQAKLILYEVH